MSNYYKFISVDQTSRIKMLNYEGHDKLGECYQIYLELSTITPTHIGSGDLQIDESGLPLSLNARDSKGNLIIPGSSFKGVIAHYHLAIFRQQKLTSSLFGFPGYMSRVLVDDIRPKSYIEPKKIFVDASWTPRKSEPGKIKIYVSKIRYIKSKYALVLECIPEGTDMNAEVTILNANEDELAQILLALGVAPNTTETFLIGFGKPKGLGKMKVKNFSIRRIYNDLKIKKVNRDTIYSKLEGLFKKYEDNFNEVYR
ncbi:MAG: hypothetical protein DRO40_07055 [Thermoprotei archaeon]|nr:MAG: hypothetical protein DRO40_07055 [Thermoprotei archaeon]